ncbi:MAG: hypothetical protein E7623_05400 [Ruminococcaceae bacterium]|nr:hypothetical protein [Oscillospiraceae bacterium]
MDILNGLIENISTLSVTLFVIGVLLLALELITPGTGAFGIIGVIVLLVNIFVTAETFMQGILMFGMVTAIILVMFVLGLVLVSKGIIPSFLVLKNSTQKEDGFSASESYDGLFGKCGKSLTDLRPSGKADIEGSVYDVVSAGEYVEADTEIQVFEVSGNRIVVKKK